MASQHFASAYVEPKHYRQLRACMVCGILRTELLFKREGCPNCEEFMQLRGDSDAIAACTSQVYEGTIAVADTRRSWVARHNRLEGYVPGTYAVQVEGVLPEEVIDAANAAGIQYIPRDGSTNEAIPAEG
ncbi:putative transcriptional elongation protein Spt4 [Delitschia confertaspora ATCC 74209]|uniref:Transcription elongation factor SPT4 n=1 Tax=Delitschia confertaspora ATCC 74209 TaxID=1513339 RepID=A0A9P4N0Z9_9PLEO|nr:putative transcriptional elongation protein Spt4 [Delitschia confertaspora ATCC 74209]